MIWRLKYEWLGNAKLVRTRFLKPNEPDQSAPTLELSLSLPRIRSYVLDPRLLGPCVNSKFLRFELPSFELRSSFRRLEYIEP